MGTMVGDDGGANQIGVAPGATWIAANGCCPSDQALIESGEWMLAPTDLNGDNPRPDLRPHIINNSWGSTVPSNDPFMEDVLIAWEAAGHLRHVVQRQQRTELQTSGSPGCRIIDLLGRRLRHQQRRSPASRLGAPARTARSSPTSPPPA